jgi:hypothetical protein
MLIIKHFEQDGATINVNITDAIVTDKILLPNRENILLFQTREPSLFG